MVTCQRDGVGELCHFGTIVDSEASDYGWDSDDNTNTRVRLRDLYFKEHPIAFGEFNNRQAAWERVRKQREEAGQEIIQGEPTADISFDEYYLRARADPDNPPMTDMSGYNPEDVFRIERPPPHFRFSTAERWAGLPPPGAEPQYPRSLRSGRK